MKTGEVGPDRIVPEAVLDTVVETARLAGSIIRAEFEREGGPRGPLGKCPVDEEAERLIRDRLRNRFPDWQFFGEETGVSGEPSQYHWLVDPNDGTSAFQRGHRGASVSIALLRGEALVLGVVLAPRPPIGDEDLICWAEGGPVTRNGEVIDRAWPETLGPYDVILVSQDADRKPTANAELTQPSRYHGVASVAYRLALAAAGEGEAAVSLAGTADYDFAAGHAILKGAGGLLLTANGEEPRYARSGGRKVFAGGLLVGGAPQPVRDLVQKPWSRVLAHSTENVPFVFPRRDRIQAFGLRLDRAQGLLLGQLIGDALGAQVAFQTMDEIAEAFPDGVRAIRDGGPLDTLAGQPTDDSEMALALARTLVTSSSYDPRSAAEAYVDWFQSGPFDIGVATRAACEAGAEAAGRGEDVSAAMRRGARFESQANGALMRAAPLALIQSDTQAAAMVAMEDARLTHPHPVCLSANAVYVAALVDGLGGGTPASMHEAAAAAADGIEGAAEVVERLQWARSEPPKLDVVDIGSVLNALQNAFFELLNAASLEEGLIRTVGRGGDTDSNGAIAGALLGAAHGASTVPGRWRRMVITCRPDSYATRPRPLRFWPVDALHIVEAVLDRT